jgi:uncharacterized membrane protein (UPF0127 family)
VRPALLLLALAAAACAGPPPLPTVTFAGRDAAARVEVAATHEARERGLMFRDLLPPDRGMLFVYPEDRPLGFWMKNCSHPLSAAFMDRDGRVLNIEEMAPGDGVPDDLLPRYRSAGDARFVLEMEAGWFKRKGVRPGDRADLAAALLGVEPR